MPIWKRILKWLAWLIGGTLALGVVAYLALLLINWRDVAPSESAQRLTALYRDRPAASDADNAYVYVMGFSVAPNADPQEAGVRRIEWIRKLRPEGPYSSSDDPVPGDTNYREKRPPAAKQISEACSPGSPNCALAFERAEAALGEWINSEKWLLDRYRTLLHRPAWVETVPPDFRAPLPAYAAVMDGQRLLLAQAYLLAKEKDAAAVRDMLGEDVRFWRHVLASSDILITKMIAVVALDRHFAVGNIVLRRLPAEMELQGMPQEWATPMTDEERSLLRVFAGELIFGEGVIQYVLQSAEWHGFEGLDTEESVFDKLTGRLSVPFYQPQDVSNRTADRFIRSNEAMSVPFEKLPEGLERARAIHAAPTPENGPFSRLYNPMGKLLLNAETEGAGYSGYGARVADVEGARRAAVLTVNLRNRKVDVQKMSTELAASEIRAPYDNKPFQWDAAAQAVVFVGLEPNERGRHSFKY